MLEGTQLGIEGRIKFFRWLRGSQHLVSYFYTLQGPSRSIGLADHLQHSSLLEEEGATSQWEAMGSITGWGGGSSQSRQRSMNWLEATESVSAFLHHQQG